MGFKDFHESEMLVEGIGNSVKTEIMQDFLDWSGGFSPSDMDEEEIEIYLDSSLPGKYKTKEKEIRKYLFSLM